MDILWSKDMNVIGFSSDLWPMVGQIRNEAGKFDSVCPQSDVFFANDNLLIGLNC